jgi:hypothetical protein
VQILLKSNLRESGWLSKVYTILVVNWVRIGRQGKHIGDARLAEDGLEDQHDGPEPSIVPVRLFANHGRHNQDLERDAPVRS